MCSGPRAVELASVGLAFAPVPGERALLGPCSRGVAAACTGRDPDAEVTDKGLKAELIRDRLLAPGWAPDTVKPGSAGAGLRSLSPVSLPGWK